MDTVFRSKWNQLASTVVVLVGSSCARFERTRPHASPPMAAFPKVARATLNPSGATPRISLVSQILGRGWAGSGGTVIADGRGMNQLQFLVKRAHWRLWGFEAALLAPFGTTPARLDMLQCIAQHGVAPQSVLIWKLGLSPSTVSKMLSLLDAQGLVLRDVDPSDYRRRLARITDAARELLAKVYRVLLKSGVASKAHARCMVDLPADPEILRSTFDRLHRVQWALEDRAIFVPDSVPHGEGDRGASLVPEERKLLSRVITYCQARFGHLPYFYILQT